MQGYKRKQTRHGSIVQWLLRGGVVLVLLVLCIFSIRATWGMYQKFVEASQGQDLVQAQLHSLQMQEQTIGAAVQELNSREGFEAQVRARYGVVKPGEGEIQIVATEPTASSTGGSSYSFWYRLWHPFSLW